MEPVRYLLSSLPLISCIAIVALAIAWLALAVGRKRRGRLDTADWIPARGTIVERHEHDRKANRDVSLTVTFSTLDGRRIEFTDELAAWQVEFGTTVPVIYDPANPSRARVIRRRRGRAA